VADFKSFNDGLNHLLSSGDSGAAKLALSTKTADEFVATEKISAGKVPSEISTVTASTGYAQQEDASPTVSGTEVKIAQKEWKTEAHTDWPATVKSAVLIMGGVMICAWNLQAGGGARDMSAANTTEKFTGTLKVA
jgi:hypothetical protein